MTSRRPLLLVTLAREGPPVRPGRMLKLVLIATLARACPRVRPDHFLLPTTANGYGNQWYALEKASWLALATNRTLILPPVLDHAGPRSWGRYPPCEHGGAQEAGDVIEKYRRVAAAGAPRWTTILDFSEVAAAGLRVVDFIASDVFLESQHRARAIFDVTGVCGKHAAHLLRDADHATILVAGSPLRMELDDLRRRLRNSKRGWRLLTAAYAPPFQKRITAAAAAAVERFVPPGASFAAVQLRTGDRPSPEAEARTAHLVTFLQPELAAHGLPIYCAYDLEASFDAFFAFLAATCDACGGVFGRRAVGVDDALIELLGPELAGVAFDVALAARAARLYLSDEAPHAFRRRSTFGRLLKRYHLRERSGNATHYAE
mmetsp:Transcript_21138/g.65020  ORF Transcript_21138/g.65020 Transcript_21138/m.65020 type:complete len:375 (+) Transcript_21138:66-1190(+)